MIELQQQRQEQLAREQQQRQQEPKHTCPACEDIIRETKGRSKGQDAVFCDGSCQMWLHRCCAGLSKLQAGQASQRKELREELQAELRELRSSTLKRNGGGSPGTIQDLLFPCVH